MKQVGAIILAGGNGIRFGADVPKQFIPINGKPMWKLSYETFATHPDIGYIVVVFPEQFAPAGFAGIAKAGKTRQESVKNGLEVMAMLYGDEVNTKDVLIHDAARPFVSHRIISDCIDCLRYNDACDTVIPSPDTIVELDPSRKRISTVPDRRSMRLGQTPQGFKFRDIQEAHASVPEQEQFTDDIGVLIAHNGVTKNIGIVEGDQDNLKITTQADLFTAERIAKKMEPVGTISLKDKQIAVFGASGGIGSAICKRLKKEGAFPVEVNRDTVDFTDEDSIVRWVKKLRKIDGLVDCVGIFKRQESIFRVMWNAMFKVNYLSHVLLFDHLLMYKKFSPDSPILILGSSSAYLGRPYYTAYTSAKAALMNWVQGVSQEREWKRLRVNILNPGRTNTMMRRNQYPDEDSALLCDPDEVAKKAISIMKTPCTGCVFDIRANGIDN